MAIYPSFQIPRRVEDMSDPASGADEVNEMAQLMDILLAQTATKSTCGLHVHVSLGHAPYNLSELKKIARSVWHFEPILFQLVPEGRHMNHYCMSIRMRKEGRDPSKLHAGNSAKFKSLIEKAQTIAEVVEICNGTTRYHSVNMQNFDGCGTIEFRLFGGVTSTKTAWSWSRLVAIFVSGALTVHEVEEIPLSMRGLRILLDLGCLGLGEVSWSNLNHCEEATWVDIVLGKSPIGAEKEEKMAIFLDSLTAGDKLTLDTARGSDASEMSYFGDSESVEVSLEGQDDENADSEINLSLLEELGLGGVGMGFLDDN